jgi:uncharacterized protein YdeI (YjbR/CyaY-like superfamily)
VEEARFFPTPDGFRAWLRANHAKAKVLQVGFIKKGTGRANLTWPQAVAEALCYGWIDGVRHRIDEDRYAIRFTPRRPGSTWSAKNIRTVAELEAAGRMTDAGRAAFAARSAAKSRTYSYEQRGAAPSALEEACVRRFRKHGAAWAFFEAQAPSYRRRVLWWVTSAKQDDARERRFRRLLESCVAKRRLT